MTGDADEARDLLIAELVQGLEYAVGSFHFGEIVRSGKAVNVDQVDLVRLEPLHTAFQNPHGIVVLAGVDLRSEPDFFPASRHYFADALFALPVAVSISGVDI